jgi:hypothetical protein
MEAPRDIFELDRVVRRHARDPSAQLPRAVSSKTVFDDLSELGDEPLAVALRRWVGWLTIRRVTIADERRIAEQRALARHLAPAGEANVSVADLVRQVACAGPDVQRWLDALLRAGGASRDAVVILAERRGEAARRLGVPDLGDVEHPPLSRATVKVAAERVLDATEAAFAAEHAHGDATATLAAGLGREAGEGWPARIGERWVRDLFRGPLLDGTSLALPPMPAPLGASSFARALAALGAEHARVDVGTGAPFCLCRDPDDSLHHARAALFASLVAEPAFHRRKLGLGAPRAVGEARKVARASLVWVRLAAARALAWQTLSSSESWSNRASTIAELFERALGGPLPRDLVGVLPRLGFDAGTALIGVVLAPVARESLRERFDEDWFDNPRAHEALRHENQSTSLARAVDAAAVDAGAQAFARWVGSTFT